MSRFAPAPHKRSSPVFVVLLLLCMAAWGGWLFLARAEDTRVGLSDAEWMARLAGWVVPFGLGFVAIRSRPGSNSTLSSNYLMLLAPVVGIVGGLLGAVGALRGTLKGLSSYSEEGKFLGKAKDQEITGGDRLSVALLFLLTGAAMIPSYYYAFRTQGVDLLSQFGVASPTYEPSIEHRAILVDVDSDGVLDLVSELQRSDDLERQWVGAYSGKDNTLLFKTELGSRDDYKSSQLFRHQRHLYLGRVDGTVSRLELSDGTVSATIQLGQPIRDMCATQQALWFQSKGRKWSQLSGDAVLQSVEDKPAECQPLADSQTPVTSAGQVFGRGSHDGITMEQVLELPNMHLLAYGSEAKGNEAPMLARYARGTKKAKQKGRNGDRLELIWSTDLARANATSSKITKRPLLAANTKFAAAGYNDGTASYISVVDIETGKSLYEITTPGRPSGLQVVGDLLYIVSRRTIRVHRLSDGSATRTLGSALYE